MDTDELRVAKDGKWLGVNARHIDLCRARWLRRRNRMPEEQEVPEHRGQHCYACQYWMPIGGALIDEFGICSNAASPFDRTARGRDDGCDRFAALT